MQVFGRFLTRDDSVLSEGGRKSPLTDSVVPEVSTFAKAAMRIDNYSVLHPFSPHKSDAGAVRLMTIVHAFNYRMAVLRDGVKSAVRVGRFRKPEGCFLANSDIPWGQQVAVMFQIVSTMALELPSFLADLENLRGMSPNVHIKSKILIFFRDVISLLARVFILLIDTATQEVPMKNI